MRNLSMSDSPFIKHFNTKYICLLYFEFKLIKNMENKT